MSEEEIDEELGDGGFSSGIFHSIDLALDKWLQSDLENRKERAAEIRSLIKDGKIEEAKKLLELYNEHAEKVEEEVSPEEKEEAEKSSDVIDEAFENLEEDLSDEDKGVFEVIREREKRIKKAAQIAEKISSLCGELALLDPERYDALCNIDNEKAPSWRKKQHLELSEEQKKEAHEFAKIMKSCFRTNGRDCDCDAIAFVPMKGMCISVKPLAIACSRGDKDACENMQSIEMPEMPPNLEAVMSEIEEGFHEDSYSQFLPPECEAQGLDPKECMAYMFELHAPEECEEALRNGKISTTNMREARHACEALMFESNAPPECIKQGITNPRECAKLFKSNIGNGGPGKRLNADRCKELQDPSEKAACFEKLYDEFNTHKGEYERDYSEYYKQDNEKRWQETMKKQEECAKSCAEQQMAWSFSNGNCQCRDGSGDYQKYYQERSPEGKDPRQYQEQFARECGSRGGRWNCEGGSCTCDAPPQQSPPFDGQSHPPFDPSQQSPLPYDSSQKSPPPSEQGSSETTPTPESTETTEAESPETQVAFTGSVILENRFLRYYFS